MTDVEIIRGLPFADYVTIDAVNVSSLCPLLRSPLHYQHAKSKTRDTAAIAVGHAAHTATLEPHLYGDAYAICTIKRDKRHKAYQEFLEKAQDRCVLTPTQSAAAQDIAKAVWNHPLAGRLLAGAGDKEVTVLWTHERTGLRLKARLDFLGAALIDLKTTNSIEPHKFARTSADFHYDIKMAFYSEAARQATGETLPTGIVAVESAAPHDIQVYDTDPMLPVGEATYERLLDDLAECRRLDKWPGVGEARILPLSLPAWVKRDNNNAPDAWEMGNND